MQGRNISGATIPVCCIVTVCTVLSSIADCTVARRAAPRGSSGRSQRTATSPDHSPARYSTRTYHFTARNRSLFTTSVFPQQTFIYSPVRQERLLRAHITIPSFNIWFIVVLSCCILWFYSQTRKLIRRYFICCLLLLYFLPTLSLLLTPYQNIFPFGVMVEEASLTWRNFRSFIIF